jgi:acyl carrier protein
MSSVREFVLDSLQKEYSFKKDVDVDSINYIEEGYMDSLELLQFIGEIEDEFSVTFTDAEMESNEFHTVGGIIALIESKVGG